MQGRKQGLPYPFQTNHCQPAVPARGHTSPAASSWRYHQPNPHDTLAFISILTWKDKCEAAKDRLLWLFTNEAVLLKKMEWRERPYHW